MIVLALDTSLGQCSAAVARAGHEPELLAEAAQAMARGHAEALMPMVEQVMREAGIAFADLNRIAATTGPGTFTGVRIAIAAARGLALATHADLWGTDSLTVMAARAARDGLAAAKPFAIAVDAKRGKVYFGHYAADGRCLAGPLLLAPDEAVASLPENVDTVLGSGAALLTEAGAQSGSTLHAAEPDLQPDAAALARLALNAESALSNLKPLYLRPPDAKPQAGKAVERC